MSFKISGKVIHKGEVMSGTSATGNSWQKRDIVIETGGSYPKKACFTGWSATADEIEKFNLGDMVEISFDVESREYNGKWYSDLKTYRITTTTEGGSAPQSSAPNNSGYSSSPPAGYDEASTPKVAAPTPEDDLPF